jgi:dihydroflavonol-4-reductase
LKAIKNNNFFSNSYSHFLQLINQMSKDKDIVLVTGGSGFIGSYCIIELLKQGYIVRATVRNLNIEPFVRKSLERGNVTAELGKLLTFYAADLCSDDGWKEVINGVKFILHVASPNPFQAAEDENELIVPARDGTLRILRAARDSHTVKRVVLTSSCMFYMHY